MQCCCIVWAIRVGLHRAQGVLERAHSSPVNATEPALHTTPRGPPSLRCSDSRWPLRHSRSHTEDEARAAFGRLIDSCCIRAGPPASEAASGAGGHPGRWTEQRITPRRTVPGTHIPLRIYAPLTHHARTRAGRTLARPPSVVPRPVRRRHLSFRGPLPPVALATGRCLAAPDAARVGRGW